MASFGPPTVGPSPPPQPIDSVSQHAPFIQKRGACAANGQRSTLIRGPIPVEP
jgi:hypothetical protein